MVIVEDHPLLAEALTALLSRDPAFSVVGTEGTAAGALAVVAREAPDLVVMDQHLPDGRGTDVAVTIRSRGTKTQIVMLTGDASDETLLAAIDAGVAGFIDKSEPAARIVSLLRHAAAGDIVIAPADLERLLRRQQERESRERDRARLVANLTPRERQVLELMAVGRDTRGIAAETGLAVNTIRGHVQTIIEKLETHSRLEAVVRATALGIVGLQS